MTVAAPITRPAPTMPGARAALLRDLYALAAAILATKPLALLFADYAQRQNYHKVEECLGRPEMTGRMARFDITPQPVPPGRLLRIIQLTMRP